ncbi:Sulfite reductase [Candidatus Terasakiella magnetica]|uniref:Sulfite reductase n=1 Tax=Candidatus Terasakiella magnetica TaxID=1867952 RepID=A0A1C3RK24_9PROT|nr:nitrite/sulfite reductase [Candidatus Terasakiella magnetica]SCA57640.1 Sulfite reductase [Candidatus Terasakiella magnetica]
MYKYDEYDQKLVDERVEQFRGQVNRRLSGELSEEEFRPLRLMNGVYLQLHAYMLRVAIPYGTMNSTQLRQFAYIARTYDKGYGHFTTRQNIQFNWPKLVDLPDILTDLSKVQMHAMQTSGNCIRNTTSDQYAGAAFDELEDPRPWCELIRQWSTMHPEFTYLPRKFKMAVTGSPTDRAAVAIHDIGLRIRRDDQGELGFEVMVGGGLGRTPMIGKTICEFLPKEDLLSYLEAILRVYNQFGRRDNKYKARIKILVHEIGADKFGELVEEEWEAIRDSALQLPQDELEEMRAHFTPPAFEVLPSLNPTFSEKVQEDQEFAYWVQNNVKEHKQQGYAIANISLKPIGGIPGDISHVQMDALAEFADQYSFGEIRATHEQNLVLAHVKRDDLYVLWQKLKEQGLATPNSGLITDLIACPGLDYCALANSRSIPLAQRISERFGELDRQHDIGKIQVKISGCINACTHHHVGHIGILGVDKKGQEFYQVTLGGRADENANIGKIVGAGFSTDEIVDAVETVVNTYISLRESKEETFLDAFDRVGEQPFKEALYGAR